MLTTSRNRSRLSTSCDDAVHETWKGWNTAEHESHDGAPVGCEFRGVAINAVEVVHIWYRDIGLVDDEVAVV